jgi:hypothetical protein
VKGESSKDVLEDVINVLEDVINVLKDVINVLKDVINVLKDVINVAKTSFVTSLFTWAFKTYLLSFDRAMYEA